MLVRELVVRSFGGWFGALESTSDPTRGNRKLARNHFHVSVADICKAIACDVGSHSNANQNECRHEPLECIENYIEVHRSGSVHFGHRPFSLES